MKLTHTFLFLFWIKHQIIHVTLFLFQILQSIPEITNTVSYLQVLSKFTVHFSAAPERVFSAKQAFTRLKIYQAKAAVSRLVLHENKETPCVCVCFSNNFFSLSYFCLSYHQWQETWMIWLSSIEVTHAIAVSKNKSFH